MTTHNNANRKPKFSQSRTRRLKRRQANKLSFDPLEPKQLLATITVGNLTDEVNAPNTSSISALLSNDGGDGISLREAITAANSSPDFDSIQFAANLGGQTIVLTQGQLPITTSIGINGNTTGENNSADITIDGNNNERVFQISGLGTDVTLQSLVVKGGYATGSFNSRFGGGVRIETGANVLIENSRFTGNSALNGGAGIYNRGVLDVQRSVFDNNLATQTSASGGGVLNSGTASLSNVTFTENESGVGAAIENRATLSLTNVTIAQNVSRFLSGGLNNSGTATLRHTTITGNTAGTASNGGGGGISNSSSLTLVGSIVLGNSANEDPEIAGSFIDGGGNIVNGSGSQVFEAVDENGGGVLADNGGRVATVALLRDVNNPALDTVPMDEDLLLDAADQERNVDIASVNNGGVADAGAFEVSSETPSLLVDILTDTVDPFDNQTSLREAVAFANSNSDQSDLSFANDLAGGTVVLTQGELLLSSDISIAGDADVTGQFNVGISGNNAGRVLNISGQDTTVRLHRLDVANGTITSEDGAGIYAGLGTTTVISDSNIYNNAAYSVVDNNGYIVGVAGNGGGISNRGTLTLVNSFVGYSFAFEGGGVHNSGLLNIVNSTFSQSIASYGGGLSSTGTTTIINSTFTANDAFDGGGLDQNGGTLSLANSIVVGNTADTAGADTLGEIDNRGGNVIGGETFDVFRNVDDSGIADFTFSNGIVSYPILNGGRADGVGDLLLLPTEADLLVDVNQDGTIDSSMIDVDAIGNSRTLFGALDAGAREATEQGSLVVTLLNDLSIPDDNETTLREAVAFANSNSDQSNITFDPSLSGQTLVLTQGELELTGTLFISGDVDQNGTVDVTISGGNASLIFNVYNSVGQDANVTLDSLNIVDGSGVYVGGIYINPGSTVEVRNSQLSGNNANLNGGAIFNRGDLTISGSRLTNNTSSMYGGAIASDGMLTIVDSTIDSNSGGIGGGIAAFGDSVLTLRNSTVSGNASVGDGGGIWSLDSTILLANSTVTDNSASGVGGGISLFADDSSDDESLTLHNSIVAGNSDDGTAPDVEALSDVANDLVVENSLIGDTTGSGISSTTGSGNVLNELALIGPLADNGGPTLTHALLTGSPAIDAGSNALAVDESGNPLTTDQRGETRIEAGTVDIGAVESRLDKLLLGDVNQDGFVNFLDISPFISLLSSNTFQDEADINRDENVDFFDIGPFISLLASSGSAQGKQFTGSPDKPSVAGGSGEKSGTTVTEPSVSSAVSLAKAQSNGSIAARTEDPIATVTLKAQDADADALGPRELSNLQVASLTVDESLVFVDDPVADAGDLSVVDAIVDNVGPVDALHGPVTFAQTNYSFVADRNFSIKAVASNGPLVTRRSWKSNAGPRDFSLGLRGSLATRPAANVSTKEPFSTAAELFDAHPESLDDVFDFEFEETFAGLID